MTLAISCPPSRKDALFLHCREKTCCSTCIVYPTGHDLWRIATALGVAPWVFSRAEPAADDAPDGFALDRSGRRYRVALSKKPRRRKGLSPCTFLVSMPDGSACCGLGALRPLACRVFPSAMTAGVLCVADGGACTCRAWSLADVDPEHECELIARDTAAKVFYFKAIAEWNSFVERAAEEPGFSYPDFCRYLLDLYAQRAARLNGGDDGS
jgi:hypothetical protein